MPPAKVPVDEALLVLRGFLDEAVIATVIVRFPGEAAFLKFSGRLSHVSREQGIHVRFSGGGDFLIVRSLEFLKFEYTAAREGDPTVFDNGIRIVFPLGGNIDILRTKVA